MTFHLRPWTSEDLPSLVRFANNPNIAKFMTNQFAHPYTQENGRMFIDFAQKGNPTHIFAIEIDGKASGGIGLHPQADIQCKNAELGYWLAEPYWGHGIITKAISEIVEYGFKTFDIDRIYARPFGNNIASQKVLEKAGFTLEARFKNTYFKNGEYLDELVYAIRKKIISTS
jgi:[ribosomal protein S5]-alanine N-acetyltransferase